MEDKSLMIEQKTEAGGYIDTCFWDWDTNELTTVGDRTGSQSKGKLENYGKQPRDIRGHYVGGLQVGRTGYWEEEKAGETTLEVYQEKQSRQAVQVKKMEAAWRLSM